MHLHVAGLTPFISLYGCAHTCSKSLQPHKHIPTANAPIAAGGPRFNFNFCHCSTWLHSPTVTFTIIDFKGAFPNSHHWLSLVTTCPWLASIAIKVHIYSQGPCSYLWHLKLVPAPTAGPGHYHCTCVCNQPLQMALHPNTCIPLAPATTTT